MKTRHRDILIRPMCDADLPAVRSAAEGQWDADDLPALLSFCLCVVAEDRGDFAGYAILEPDADRWLVIAFEALPLGREAETADELWRWMSGRVTPEMPHLDIYIPSDDARELDALRGLGFKAWRLTPDRKMYVMRKSLYLGGPVRPHGDIDEPHGYGG